MVLYIVRVHLIGLTSIQRSEG